MKIALLAAGQGSQYPEMALDLVEKYPSAAEIFKKASDIFGFDLLKMSKEAPAEELARTLHSQPLIFTHSCAAFAALREEIPNLAISAVCGHSLGEYAALTAAGAISFEDGCRLIRARSIAMDRAAALRPGSMAAILKLSPEVIAEVCESVDGYVLPVNFNSPKQTVIAGETPAVDAAIALLSEKGGRAVRLAVSSAFHSEFMAPAAEELKAAAAAMDYRPLTIPFYSNVTGGKYEPEDYPAYFAKHLVSPVRFTDELAALEADGFDTFLEVGPGKVLTGLVKKTIKPAIALNIENADTLAAAAEAVKAAL